MSIFHNDRLNTTIDHNVMFFSLWHLPMAFYTRWKLQPWCYANMVLWCTKTIGALEYPSGCILCQNLLSVWSWAALIAQILSAISERLISSIWWLNERCWIWLSSWQSLLLTLCKSGKSGCIAYWSTTDSRWKRFIQGCYMAHFLTLCNNLLNKICGGKEFFLPKCHFPSKPLCLEQRCAL